MTYCGFHTKLASGSDDLNRGNKNMQNVPRGFPNDFPKHVLLHEGITKYPYLAARLRPERTCRAFLSFVQFCTTPRPGCIIDVKYIAEILNGILEERSGGFARVHRLHGIVPERDFVLSFLTYYYHTPCMPLHRALIGSRRAGVRHEFGHDIFVFAW